VGPTNAERLARRTEQTACSQLIAVERIAENYEEGEVSNERIYVWLFSQNHTQLIGSTPWRRLILDKLQLLVVF
jgi:hypothetical protein